jgi:aminoglycoside phosphotransferase (APT) family kinase protein
MDESVAMLELLRRDGIIHAPDARLALLTGGVSSEIYLVEDSAERFVVKRALPKLKVQADWFADVNRNRHEWEFIAYVARFLPAAVPALRHCSSTGGYFAMEHLNGEFSNWKQLLLAGSAEAKHAVGAAKLLAQIHRHSAGDAEAKRLFDTTANFHQLRVEPYLLATGEKKPGLASVVRGGSCALGSHPRMPGTWRFQPEKHHDLRRPHGAAGL